MYNSYKLIQWCAKKVTPCAKKWPMCKKNDPWKFFSKKYSVIVKLDINNNLIYIFNTPPF